MNPPTDISGSLNLAAFSPILLISRQLVEERGDPNEWQPAPRYPDLASSIIDALMSPRIPRVSVEAVIERFHEHFPEAQTSTDLTASFDVLPGEQWRITVGTHHRAWASVNAPYKSEVIREAAHELAAMNIKTPRQLRQRAHDDAVRDQWCSLPGQHSGSSWRHLLLVTGVSEPMVCPLTRRFVRRAVKDTGLRLGDDDIQAAMKEVAEILKRPVTEIDHQMWRAGSGAPHGTTNVHVSKEGAA